MTHGETLLRGSFLFERERVRQLNLCRDRPPTAGCSVTTARPSRALAVGFLLTLTLVRLPNADLGSWSELA